MAELVRRRFFPLLVVLVLQLGLVISLGALLWFAKVKDRFITYGTYRGGQEMVIEIEERDVGKVAPGGQMELYLEGSSNPLRGRVTEIVPGKPVRAVVKIEGQPLPVGEKVEFTAEVRTRRLLKLLFRR